MRNILILQFNFILIIPDLAIQYILLYFLWYIRFEITISFSKILLMKIFSILANL